MITIEFLITTLHLTEEQIINLIIKANVFGNIIVGNQYASNDSVKIIKRKDFTVTIVNQTGSGVSKNRNTILKHATSDYVTFLDDDMVLTEKKERFFSLLDNFSEYDAIRFNCISSNVNRPIKQIKKNGYVNFRKMKSFGTWGIFYKRSVLIETNIAFRENIGPGNYINHGEDTLFVYDFLKSNRKIYQIKLPVFLIEQTKSTWKDSKDLKRELISHGYNYYLLYHNRSFVMALIFVCLHHKLCGNLSIARAYSFMKVGIRMSREASVKK